MKTTLEKIIERLDKKPNELGLLFSKNQIISILKSYLEDEQKELDEAYYKGFISNDRLIKVNPHNYGNKIE